MDANDRKRAPGGGRKKEVAGELHRHQVMLDEDTCEYFKAIGGGNLSAGIRKVAHRQAGKSNQRM